MRKRILFLTTHNLGTNPRLVKELRLALEYGFHVHLICFEFDNWSKGLNENLKNEFKEKLEYIGIPGNRKPFLPWFISSLIFSSAKFILNFFPNNFYLNALSSNKRTWLLLKALKKTKPAFDLVVAHNPGAFFPAFKFARKHEIPFGIDLEDYHPGESNDEKTNERYKKLNRSVLPWADYVTAASPLILQYSEADLEKPLENKYLILNYFPKHEFVSPIPLQSEKLQLVWFSQNVSFNRGLEQLIPIIEDVEQIELHLFGNCDEAFRKQWLEGRENVKCHNAMTQAKLHKQLSNFDVGLALESGKVLNYRLALTNKLLTYYQAGLYILTSDTEAQKHFLQTHSGIGIYSSLNFESLSSTVQKLIEDKAKIRFGN